MALVLEPPGPASAVPGRQTLMVVSRAVTVDLIWEMQVHEQKKSHLDLAFEIELLIRQKELRHFSLCRARVLLRVRV